MTQVEECVIVHRVLTKSDIGKRLREAREAAGLKQTELAVKLDVTQATVANYERGFTTPSLTKLRHISDVLNVELMWLIEGDKEAA